MTNENIICSDTNYFPSWTTEGGRQKITEENDYWPLYCHWSLSSNEVRKEEYIYLILITNRSAQLSKEHHIITRNRVRELYTIKITR